MEDTSVNQPVAIDPTAALPPAADFRLLRSEGISTISRLAAASWTDHNVHDPGITILDLLCYAITGISYRLGFDIKDLLAHPKGNPYQSLYSPATVLTTNPLTIPDFRKLLIDIEGVKNAWLQKLTGNAAPVLYYYPASGIYRLIAEGGDQNQPVLLKGVYSVLLVPEQTGVVELATERLMATRNVCEDFSNVKELPAQLITVSGKVELGKTNDINQTVAGVLYRLANYLSPRPRFRTLAEMLASGKTTDEIFEGPALQHGFLDDAELDQYTQMSELPVSDIIREMMDEPGVLFVSSVTIAATGSNSTQNWLLELDKEKVAQLDVSSTLAALTFTKAGTVLALNEGVVNRFFQDYLQQCITPTLPVSERDIVVPAGSYQPLGAYYSIQNELPQVYGVGKTGLPESATVLRQAQASQLQAYLLLYEQILAACTSQVEGLRELFSFYNHQAGTYFYQSLKGNVSGAETLLSAGSDDAVKTYTEDPETAIARKNRFLDHLIARFGESMFDYTLQTQSYEQLSGKKINDNDLSQTAMPPRLIEDKLRFLQSFPTISGGRSTGVNYALYPEKESISGLQKRVAARLGIAGSSVWSADQPEGFFLIEHLLLRPTQDDVNEFSAYAAAQPDQVGRRPVERVEGSGPDKWIVYTKNHGLITGDLIMFDNIGSTNATGSASPQQNAVLSATNPVSVSYLTPDSFGVNGALKLDPSMNLSWSRYFDQALLKVGPGSAFAGQADLFSLQLTCLFPDVAGRYASAEFKAFVENLVRKEVPAHLTLYIRWLAPAEMQVLANAYYRFFTEKALIATDERTPILNRLAYRAWRNRLLEAVIPGSTAYPLAGISAPEAELVVPYNQPALIVLPYSEDGMIYTLMDEWGNSINGDGATGTDGPLTLQTLPLTKDRYRTGIWVSSGPDKPRRRLYQTVNIRLGINNKLIARVKDGPVRYGSKGIIVIESAQSDTVYQLLDSKKKLLSEPVTTPANTVQDLEIETTNALQEDTVVTVLVTGTQGTSSGTLETKPVLLVYPNTSIKPETDSAAYDYDSTATVLLSGTQTTATYQLYLDDIDDDRADKTRRPIGEAITGNKKVVKLPVPDLTEDLTLSVVAHKTDSELELTLEEKVIIPVRPSTALQPLSVVEPVVKSGETATILVSSTQPGVWYQLRRMNADKTTTDVGVPVYHHKNYGIGKARLEVEFAIDTFTSDHVLLPTDTLTETTRFEVLATKATTKLQAVVGNITVEIKS